MASVIPLHQRSVLPPSRTAGVKPPTGLADQSGGIRAGQALAKFGGDTFARLEQTRVANEEADFQGTVKKSMGEFDAFVAGNPGASFQDLEKQREKMLTGIKAAGNSSTMPLARQNNNRWYAKNLDSIRLQTQASMEAIQAKHQLRAAEQTAEGYINSFDRESLVSFTNQQVKNDLWEKTFAEARLKNQLEVIDAAEAKVAVANASQVGFDAWQATVDETEDPDGDLQEGFDAIEALEGLTGDQKRTAESAMESRVSNRRAESKLEAEQATTKSVEEINGKLNKGEFDGINVFIDKLPISETEKVKQKKTAGGYISTVNSYKDDAVTSNQTRIEVLALTSNVKSGDISFNNALDFYKLIADGAPINTTDGKSFINGLFAAKEAAKSVTDRRQNAMLGDRERQLRDSIEKQPSFFPAEEAEEILQDLANEAVIQLNDKFREGEFTKEQVDAEVDRLIRTFSLTDEQQIRAVTARQFKLAESLDQQQEALRKNISALIKQGKRTEAKALLEEAIRLGIYESAEKDGTVKKTKGKNKVNIQRGFLDRLQEQFK